MLPSGPGGVRRFSLRGAQPSTPPREAHSTRSALEKEFNPAEADCGLQGTANSPSSTAKRNTSGGGAGIRTRGTGVTRARHFQCRTFGRSVTPPHFWLIGTSTIVGKIWRRGEDLNPRGTFWAPIRFRVGRLRPGSATPPHYLPNDSTTLHDGSRRRQRHVTTRVGATTVSYCPSLQHELKPQPTPCPPRKPVAAPICCRPQSHWACVPNGPWVAADKAPPGY